VIRRQGIRAVVIAVSREFVGPRGALFESLVTVPLEHQLRGTPNIDIRYHLDDRLTRPR
jgi:hypothetical protein